MLLSNLQDPLSLHEEKLELTRGQTFTCRFGHCTPIVDTIGLRWQLRSSHVCGCATSFRFRNDWLLVTIQLAPFPLRFSFRQFQVFIIIVFIFFIALKKWPLSLCKHRFQGILSFRTGLNHRLHCTWHLFKINVPHLQLCDILSFQKRLPPCRHPTRTFSA